MTKVPVWILGAYVSYNEEENAKRNFAKKVQNLNATLDLEFPKSDHFWHMFDIKMLGY